MTQVKSSVRWLDGSTRLFGHPYAWIGDRGGRLFARLGMCFPPHLDMTVPVAPMKERPSPFRETEAAISAAKERGILVVEL